MSTGMVTHTQGSGSEGRNLDVENANMLLAKYMMETGKTIRSMVEDFSVR